MILIFDFSDNQISQNITEKIMQKGAATVAALQKAGCLRNLPKRNTYPFHCYLSAEFLDDYAQAAETSVGYFFFSEDQPSPPGYTPWDEEIVRYLDALSAEQLQKAYNVICELFPCEFPYQYDSCNCHQRISARLRAVPGAGLATKNIVLDPTKKWHLDVSDELARLRSYRYKYDSFRYRSEYWADLATFTGISLHWILNIKGPLFCKTATGDKLFDHITFLTRDQQRTAWCILKTLADTEGGAISHAKPL